MDSLIESSDQDDDLFQPMQQVEVTSSTKNKKEKRPVGRPKNQLWQHFQEHGLKVDGHVGSSCNYCESTKEKGQLLKMHAHLALHCLKAPREIKEEYLRKYTKGELPASSTSKTQVFVDIAKGTQPRITEKFQKVSIDIGQLHAINKSLVQFFVCCGIPFWVVGSPFFLNFVKNLCYGYKPPNRYALSNNWIDQETARATVSIEDQLKREENLTLALDGWSTSQGYSYFAFVIITSDRRQFVHSVKDYSKTSHTAIFTADEIVKVLTDIGVEKFGAVVSDGAAAMRCAKEIIHDKYPYILPVRCVAHHIQLICTDIVKKIKFAEKTLQKCQLFITFFKQSHISGAQLRDETRQQLVTGGGFKSSVKTRWSTAWDCCESLLRLETTLKALIETNPSAMNADLRNLVNDRSFWGDVECLSKVLLPAKTAVQSVEYRTTTMADVFLVLIQMAIAINNIPQTESAERTEFRKTCIGFYNKRWSEFDTDMYLLAYFLHPKYRSKGLVADMFQTIQRKALAIWKDLGGGINSARVLVAQIRNYDAFKAPYNFSFQEDLETPDTWWASCKQSQHHLQTLALRILAITPHSAGCERVFSVLNWFTQKRRNRLTVEKVSNMAKLHSFYVTNAKKELNYIGHNISDVDFEKVMSDYWQARTSNANMFADDEPGEVQEGEENIEEEEEEEEEDEEEVFDDEEADEEFDLGSLNTNNLAISEVVDLGRTFETDKLLALPEQIEHGDKDFDIEELVGTKDE